MTYNEQIEAISREMQQNCELVVNTHNLNTIFVPAAHIAVGYIVSELKEAMPDIAEYEWNRILKERGLIPDNAQALPGQCPECGTDYIPGSAFCRFCKKYQPTIKRMGKPDQEAGEDEA